MDARLRSLRHGVLIAAQGLPVPTRGQWLRRQCGAWLGAFALFTAVAACMGLSPMRARPSAYVMTLISSFALVATLPTVSALAFCGSSLGPPGWLLRAVAAISVPLLALSSFAANVLAPETLRAPHASWNHLLCPLTVALTAGLATLLLVHALGRIAPADSTARVLISACASWAALAVSIHCELADPCHVLATHVFPVFALSQWWSPSLSRRLDIGELAYPFRLRSRCDEELS
jgi:hypothetical protein